MSDPEYRKAYEMIDRQQARIAELERELANRRQCTTCYGTPHASGLPCICGGTNNADEENKQLRLAAMKAQESEKLWRDLCDNAQHDVKLLASPELQNALDTWRAVDPLYRDVALVGLETMLKKRTLMRDVFPDEHTRLLDVMEKIRALLKAAAR